MTLHAERSRVRGPKKMLIISAMRLMTSGASLLEGGLVKMGLLMLFSLIRMAGKAGIHRVRLDESRSLSRVRIVAGNALTLGAGVLDFRGLDSFGLLIMAGDAQRPRIGLRQNDFAVFRFRVTGVAGIAFERSVNELLHQLGACGLMRVMTGGAVCVRKRLAVMSFDQCGVFYVVTVSTKCRDGFLQVVIEFLFAKFAGFVNGVAGIAATVERGVPAALVGNVYAGVMTL